MFKILVVDDEPDILKIVRFRLQKEGYEIITAVDGEEGLNLAKTLSPDLIMLDLRMPKMNGDEVCQKLRAEKKFKKTPIVFLTASQPTHVAATAQEFGANDYLVKPFEPQALINLVKKYLVH